MDIGVQVIGVGMRTQRNGQVLDSVDLQVEGSEPINLREVRVVVDWHLDEMTVRRKTVLAQDWDIELAPGARVRIQLGQSSHAFSQAPICIRVRQEHPIHSDEIGDLQVLFQDDKLLDYVTIDVDANPVWYRDLEDRR